MATWAAFSADAPELAASGHTLLHQFGPGLAFLATVRADGGPRLHPMCPLIVAGGLWALIGPSGPKCADLRRDGRYALHAFTPEDVDDEFLVMGRATESADTAARGEVAGAAGWKVQPHEVLFALDIERAMLAVYKSRGDWPPTYTVWHDPAAR